MVRSLADRTFQLRWEDGCSAALQIQQDKARLADEVQEGLWSFWSRPDLS